MQSLRINHRCVRVLTGTDAQCDFLYPLVFNKDIRNKYLSFVDNCGLFDEGVHVVRLGELELGVVFKIERRGAEARSLAGKNSYHFFGFYPFVEMFGCYVAKIDCGLLEGFSLLMGSLCDFGSFVISNFGIECGNEH